jgi:hypothetical protein
MHVNRRFLSWGVFLILVGAIPLLVRAGSISEEQIASWWNLWPLVIVGIGIGLVLSRTPFEILGNLVVAGTFGLMFGALVAVGVSGFPGVACGSGIGSTELAGETGTFGGPAEVDIEFNCGELVVTGASGDAWTFGGRGDADRQPSVDADADSLRIRAADNRDWVPFEANGERWEVGLPDAQPLSLDVQLNAGEATVQPGAGELRDVRLQVNFGAFVADLGAAAAIGNVDVQTNAGSASVNLPNESLTGRLQVNAGSIEFCTPAGAGLRLTMSGGGLGSNNFDVAGLTRSGDTWESAGYANAAVQIDLRTEANLGSIALNPEDGCDG